MTTGRLAGPGSDTTDNSETRRLGTKLCQLLGTSAAPVSTDSETLSAERLATIGPFLPPFPIVVIASATNTKNDSQTQAVNSQPGFINLGLSTRKAQASIHPHRFRHRRAPHPPPVRE